MPFFSKKMKENKGEPQGPGETGKKAEPLFPGGVRRVDAHRPVKKGKRCLCEGYDKEDATWNGI